MRVRRIAIENFRGVAHGTVNLPGHTLLVGGNNIGKSTVCEALDLALGAERLFRRPIVDEHDFHNGRYFDDTGNLIVIKIEVVLIDLPEDMRRKLFHKTRPWSEETKDFVDVDGSTPSDTDARGVMRALPITFLGWYDRKTDDFEGKTFFSHPAKERLNEPDNPTPGNELELFGRDWKLACGFIYLRTLRTGRRALSLERGSLLDTILRLGDKGREFDVGGYRQTSKGVQPACGLRPAAQGDPRASPETDAALHWDSRRGRCDGVLRIGSHAREFSGRSYSSSCDPKAANTPSRSIGWARARSTRSFSRC